MNGNTATCNYNAIKQCNRAGELLRESLNLHNSQHIKGIAEVRNILIVLSASLSVSSYTNLCLDLERLFC